MLGKLAELKTDWVSDCKYLDLNFDELKAIVNNGYPVDKIVLGMLGTQIKSLGNFQQLCDEIVKCENEYGYIFGGVFIWEYYDQPKDWLKSDKPMKLPEGFEPVGKAPPLPKTPMPDQRMVASMPQINQGTGLTQTEAALLSPSEQVIARRT